jgi:hypothetical protein
MPRFHPEAFLFCVVWAMVAVAGAMIAGIWAGLVLSGGLVLVLMPVSAAILTRTEDLALERQVRWALLAIAALGTLVAHQLLG